MQENKKLAKTDWAGLKPTFLIEIERQLVEHLKMLESRFFGLTRRNVLEFVYKPKATSAARA